MPKALELTGKRFGRLVVLERDFSMVGSRSYWKCKCDCGNECIVLGTNLTIGHTKSCGCFNVDHAMKHGKARSHKPTRLYTVWLNMRARCLIKTNNNYQHYGGRGISICDEWDEFSAFEKWALENGYDESAERGKCTLDRIDVNGNYEPSNCRWVSSTIQQRNKRNTPTLKYRGEEKTLREWCEIFKVPYQRAYWRMKHGWTPNEVLFGKHDAIAL